MQAIVVGAGVSGLSSAICLLEAGFSVHLITREMPDATTSAVAGAIWYPLSSLGHEPQQRWALHTGRRLATLLDQPSAGVTQIRLREPITEAISNPQWQKLLQHWQQIHPDITTLSAQQLPPGYPIGIQYTTYLIETPVYMAYLLQRFQELGGTLTVDTVTELNTLIDSDQIVVNCTGAWAGPLVADPHVYPIRGQIVRIAAQPHLDHGHHLFDGPLGVSYIFPRGGDCVLGGTYEVGSWSRQPEAATSAAIWERCLRLEPSLAGAEVLDVRVGLRPGRHAVRLEVETQPHGALIHNYGHGGIGFTLSWGCAAEVAALACTLDRR